MYYTAKCMRLLVCFDHDTNYVVAHKEDDPERALKEFHDIVEQEEEKGDWYVDLTMLILLSYRYTGVSKP